MNLIFFSPLCLEYNGDWTLELSWVLPFIIRMEGVEGQDLNRLAETGDEGQVHFVNQTSPDY